MNHSILAQLQSFTRRESVDLALTRDPLPEERDWPPIAKYILDLKVGTKPETASEHLFRDLAREVLNVQAFSQVNIGDGFVDFILPEVNGSAVVVELKPLFHRYHEIELRPRGLKPKQHLDQIRKYLHHHEYAILTDLKDAWLFSARDTLVDGTWFATLPFAELLDRAVETRSLVDTLRRAEDAVEKPELDRQFFEDLRDWFNVFKEISFTKPESSAELVILLINKLIFAKTLEDHGLVPYRFVQDEYDKQKERWAAKGPPSIIRSFLRNLEEFFDEYYDTELFEKKIWDHLDRDPDNLGRFARALDLVLGVSKWDQVFSRGIVHYNYRRINEDIFGKSYEMFLASNRKDEGIYYTPAPITTPMADSLVASLFSPLVEKVCAAIAANTCDFDAAEPAMDELTNIRIADTAAGSGGFLIKILRAIWAQYLRIDEASAWVKKLKGDLFDMPANVQRAAAFRERHSFDNRRVLVARILLRHIYAVDKDAGALEVAKTNVWKEAVKLTPADYNFRQLTGHAQRILPNLELNFHGADSLVDVEAARQVAHLSGYSQHALRKLAELRGRYIENPSDHAPLEEALAVRSKLGENLAEHFQHDILPEPPAFLALMFFPCWFGKDGTARENPGFDGIIGNPPWEAVKPVRKEFAQRMASAAKIEKNATLGVDFEAWFAKRLADDSEFAGAWQTYESDYERYKEFLALRFQHQGTGDWNLFKLFIERDLTLLRAHGRLSLLIPSAIQTDEGCGALRRLFFSAHTLEELNSWENRGYKRINPKTGEPETAHFFPDVDNRFKFSFIKVVKGQPTPDHHEFDARFYMQKPDDFLQPPVRYRVEMARQFSPENLALVEFRSGRDYELFERLRNGHPFFATLGYRFRRELHATGDSELIEKAGSGKTPKNRVPLYEGRMIHQFNNQFAPARFVVRLAEAREELLRREIHRLADFVRDSEVELLEGKPKPVKRPELESRLQEIFAVKKFTLDCDHERLAFREIAASTNERTLIAALVPSGVCMNHKLMYLIPTRYKLATDGTLTQEVISADDVSATLGLLNSLLCNYYIRSRVSSTVSVHFVQELPVPKLDAKQKKQLAAAAAKLSKKPDDVKERAKLETFIARDLYGLTPGDWKHLTSTFTFGDGDSKAELDEIIRLSIEGW